MSWDVKVMLIGLTLAANAVRVWRRAHRVVRRPWTLEVFRGPW